MNKSDNERPRLVGKEFAHGSCEADTFASTPPLEAFRLLVSDVATVTQETKGGESCDDVRRGTSVL